MGPVPAWYGRACEAHRLGSSIAASPSDLFVALSASQTPTSARRFVAGSQQLGCGGCRGGSRESRSGLLALQNFTPRGPVVRFGAGRRRWQLAASVFSWPALTTGASNVKLGCRRCSGSPESLASNRAGRREPSEMSKLKPAFLRTRTFILVRRRRASPKRQRTHARSAR
jgi:hypothetical protein